ncbi:alginate export family protein [Candidatus Omnitrophota bacterium]
MKFLKVICVIAMVFAISAVAYAETQSVKISGDIAARAFARDNYDLISDHNDQTVPPNGGSSSDWSTFLQSTVEIQIDADLTDNVSGVIRLLNQRVWSSTNYTTTGAREAVALNAARDGNIARGAAGPGTADAYSVIMDLAYIELKEFLYSPLTLRIGRQDLWFGKGFIIGNSLQDPTGALYAPEYTAVNSFDAIRATLDYDPWTIDAVYAKISENFLSSDDDENLVGVNVGYIFDDYNAEAEGYWWLRMDRNPGGIANVWPQMAGRYGNNSNDINTWGLRGSFDPIEDWTVALEGALQHGDFMGFGAQDDHRARLAFAIDAMVECRIFQDDYAWKPVMTFEYIFYSGEENIGNRTARTNGTYTGWDPMYRGKFDTAIREWQNVFYPTAQYSTPASTNEHQVLFGASVEPTDSVTIDGKLGFFWLDKSASTNTAIVNEFRNKYVGTEVDLNVTWDYTEDVSFGLLSAFFFPGSHFSEGSGFKQPATDLVATAKLSF